jgi:RNA polymerase sigma factor (sigma-70 family)
MAYTHGMSYMPGLDVDDLISETKLKLLQNASKYDPELSERAWIIKTIQNCILDIRRKIVRKTNKSNGSIVFDQSIDFEDENSIYLNIADLTATPEEELIWQDILNHIRKELNAFQRDVFNLLISSEYTSKDKARRSEKMARILNDKYQQAYQKGLIGRQPETITHGKIQYAIQQIRTITRQVMSDPV